LDQLDTRLCDFAKLRWKALPLVAAEPDANATDSFVADPISPLDLYGGAILTEALELLLKLMHMLENLSGVGGDGLGENARRAE
jgi:hypothetical protein